MNPDLSSIARALDRLAAAQQKGPWDYIGTAAIVLTLIVLIWYTYETYRLRKAAQAQTEKTAHLLREAQKQSETSMNLVQEAQRQNEIAVMPILVIDLCGTSGLAFRNVGTGPAFDISIDGYASAGAELRFEYEETVITPGEEHKLRFELKEGHRGTVGTVNELYGWINMELLPNPLKITVRCRSVGSIDYAFTFGFSPSEGRLKIAFEGMESIPRA